MLILALAFCALAAPRLSAQKEPNDPEMAKAVLLLKQGHYQEAIEAYKRLNAQQGKESAECYWRMAQAYWALKDLKKTAENCDRVFRYAGANVRLAVMAHDLKGLAAEYAAMQSDHNKFKEAEKEFQAAYELDKGFPDRSRILVNLGITQLQAGETVQGVATLKEFLAQVPQGELADRARKLIAEPRFASIPAAPKFYLKSHDGQTYSLDQLRGKIVLLDFWATWCPACRESIPSLEHLAATFSGAPFVILSISGDDRAKAWQKFIDRHEMNWPQYLDTDRSIARLFNIQYLPTHVLIGPDGAVLVRQVGWEPGTERMFRNQIAKKLKSVGKQTAQSSKM